MDCGWFSSEKKAAGQALFSFQRTVSENSSYFSLLSSFFFPNVHREERQHAHLVKALFYLEISFQFRECLQAGLHLLGMLGTDNARRKSSTRFFVEDVCAVKINENLFGDVGLGQGSQCMNYRYA